MHKLRFHSTRTAKANLSTTRLEIYAVRTRLNLFEFAVRRQPYLNVIRLGGRESQIARHMLNDPVMQIEFLQNRLSIACQTFKFIGRLFGGCQFYQFNFLKLMLPINAARVAPITSG